VDAGTVLMARAALDGDLIDGPLEARPPTLLLRHEPDGCPRLLVPPLRDGKQALRERMTVAGPLVQ
jgi:hypothetical protein